MTQHLDTIALLYLGSSGVLVVAGLVMVGMALRAYKQTERRSMMHLSIGFTIVVAATAGTAIATYLLGPGSAQSVLLVNNGLTSVGYIFVVYSLVSYE